MASFIQTASGSSARIGPIGTDKVRIAATSSIAVAIGNSSITANTTACEIIPAGVVERSFTVGQGNYIAYIGVGTATNQPFSVTELGMHSPDQ